MREIVINAPNDSTALRSVLARAKIETIYGNSVSMPGRYGPYVYIYYDPKDEGQPFYIGKGCDGRCVELSNRSNYFLNKLRSMRNGERCPTILLSFISTHERALQLEGALVEFFGRRDLGTGPLVNLTAGGLGISSPSAETREKISSSKKGKPRSAETIAKIIASKRGKPLSPELLAKIRVAAAKRIGTKMPRSAVEKIRAWHTGKKRSPESVERIRAARLGKTLSPEHRAAISAGNMGKTLSAAHRANLSAARLGKFTGRSPSADTRAKMSASHRGRTHSAESIAKMRAAKLGVKKSPEARAKMSIAKKAMWAARRAAEAAQAQVQGTRSEQLKLII